MDLVSVICRVISAEHADFVTCAAIRTEVFVHEQGVPLHEELDELDADAAHVLAEHHTEAVGTGRVYMQDAETARIGRMAVLKSHRGQGVGTAILFRLMEIARERGAQRARLAGQLHAIPFYERFAFIAYGDVFVEAGVEHRWMDRALV
ncbi:MAG: GNAT family N-acetyltransferase [Chloroflexi bacterium]|nr:GNAT family N-acetyltransferase [Chloroflexota bacterium]